MTTSSPTFLSFLAFSGFLTGLSSQFALTVGFQRIGNVRNCPVMYWYMGTIAILCAIFAIAQAVSRRTKSKENNHCETNDALQQKLLRGEEADGRTSPRRCSKTAGCLMEASVGSLVLVGVTSACLLIGGGQMIVQNLGLLLMGEACILFIACLRPSDVVAPRTSIAKPTEEIAIISPELTVIDGDLTDALMGRTESSLWDEAAFGAAALVGISAAWIYMGGLWAENLMLLLVAETCIVTIVWLRPQRRKSNFIFTLSNETANDLPLVLSV